MVTLFSLITSILYFTYANDKCTYGGMSIKGQATFNFFSNSFTNVWWVVPVIIVYWPPGKCGGSPEPVRERSKSRTESIASTGGVDYNVNEEEDCFSDEDNKSDNSDFNNWAEGKTRTGD